MRLRRGCGGVIGQYSPDAAAVEDVFISSNAKSALKLAQVRGVALLMVAEASLTLAEYTPREIKLSVTGYGNAEKSQVQIMVRSLLRLPEAIASEDASDAVAAAICHAAHAAGRPL